MTMTMLVLNLIVGLASAGFGVLAFFRPGQLVAGTTGSAGESFYVQMYAVRAVPFGVLAGLAPFYGTGGMPAALLGVAALIQIGDVVIGAQRRMTSMVAGAAIAALVHGATILFVL